MEDIQAYERKTCIVLFNTEGDIHQVLVFESTPEALEVFGQYMKEKRKLVMILGDWIPEGTILIQKELIQP